MKMNEDDETLSETARKALRDHGNDVDRAIIALCADPISRRKSADLIKQAWQTILGRCLSGMRSDVLEAARTSDGTIASRLTSADGHASWARRARQRNALLLIMTWWFVGTVPLGEAGETELRESIGRRTADARTTMQGAQFETEVLKDLKAGKRVKECYTAEALAKIAIKCGVAEASRERSNAAVRPGKRSHNGNQSLRMKLRENKVIPAPV